jgi:hypothetical protein
MVLTYDAYSETIEEKQSKEKDVESLREDITLLKEAISYAATIERSRQTSRDIKSLNRNLSVRFNKVISHCFKQVLKFPKFSD